MQASRVGNDLHVLLVLTEWNMETVIVLLNTLCVSLGEHELVLLLHIIRPDVVVNLRVLSPLRKEFVVIDVEVVVSHMVIG